VSINETELDRRTLLLAATVVTGATATSKANETPAKLGLSSPLPLPSPLRRGSEVRAAIDRSAWITAKHRLLQQTQFDWLSDFAGDVSVDTIVHKVTSDFLSVEPPYDPYQIELLVSSASSLLDRCLTYRREMYDLEERAVRRALEYQLFNDQYEAQLNIELAPRIQTQRTLERDGQRAGYSAFKNANSDVLAAGFAAITDGGAKSSNEAIASEMERKQNVRTKWQKLKDFQETLQARHNTPGHSLNYGERYNRTRAFLEQDIAVAYQKTRCIELAAHEIFGIERSSLKLDEPSEFGYLDTLVTFLRTAIEELQNATKEEIDFEHIIPLHFGRAKSGRNSVVDDAPWNAALGNPGGGNGRLSFSLKNEFPNAVSRLRVRGIGLSVLWLPDIPDSQSRLRAISAVIFPPEVKNLPDYA
jgi:hypothetical protein